MYERSSVFLLRALTRPAASSSHSSLSRSATVICRDVVPAAKENVAAAPLFNSAASSNRKKTDMIGPAEKHHIGRLSRPRPPLSVFLLDWIRLVSHGFLVN